jgi:hypothetical protein
MPENLTAAGEQVKTTFIELQRRNYGLDAEHYQRTLAQALEEADSLPSEDPTRDERYAKPFFYTRLLALRTGLLAAFGVPMMTAETTFGHIESMTRAQIGKRFSQLGPEGVEQEVSTFLEYTGIKDSVSAKFEEGLKIGESIWEDMRVKYAASPSEPEGEN